MSVRYKKWKDIFLVWLTLLVVLERNGDVGDVDEDVGGGCDVDVGGAVFQRILVSVFSDLAKRVEEEATLSWGCW